MIGKIVENIKTKSLKKKLIILVAILLIVIIIFMIVKYWTFSNYKVEVSDAKENTLLYNYYSIDGNILKCASDTAVLSDYHDETIWSITYEMNEPEVEVCGENFIIYEKNGTTVIVCDTEGQKSTFNTQLPIVKADIAEQGTIAVLEDDGSTAQIDYYDTDGSLISTIKTTLTVDGYPMDIALADDGMLLGVSFIKYDNGNAITDIVFYNFGAAGQMQKDNIVSRYEYTNTIIPELDFMGSSNCVAFGTDKVIAYADSKAPKEANIIELNDELKSVVSGDDCFATVMIGNENQGYEITVYNRNGKEKAVIETDFAYTSVEIKNGLIIMYNRNSMKIYSTDGICKFDGQLDFFIRQIRTIDSNRYAVAATDGYNIIRLY
jgi:hypothetical protein